MNTVFAEQVKQEIVYTLDELPEDSLLFLKDITHLPRTYTDQRVFANRRVVKLGGLWMGIDFSEDEIAQARHEVWESLGRDFDA
jgi:hypothetical protein